MKTTKNLLLMTAVSACILSTSAMAGIMDQFKTQNGVTPDNHFTFSGQVGYGSQDLPNDIKTGDYHISNIERKMTGFSWRAALGYSFAVSPTFSLGPEIGYGMIPSTQYNFNTGLDRSITAASIKWSAYYSDALAVAEFKFNPKFSLFAKGGMAYVEQKITAQVAGSSDSRTKGAFAPEAGVGLGFKFNDNVMLTFGGNYIFADHVGDQLTDITGVDRNKTDNVKLASFANVMLGLTFYI